MVGGVQVLKRRLGSNQSKAGHGTMAEERAALNADLERVLRGQRPRLYGEPPSHVGQFAQMAPSKRYNKLLRLKK